MTGEERTIAGGGDHIMLTKRPRINQGLGDE